MDEQVKDSCAVDGCGFVVYAKGLCTKHYHHNRSYGHPTAKPDGLSSRSNIPRADSICRVPECGREVQAKGLCSRHYQKSRSDPTFNPLVAEGFKAAECIVPECGGTIVSKGLCMKHYQYKRAHPEWNPQNPNLILAGSVDKQGTLSRLCSVMACASRVHATGLCKKHYYRKVRGSPIMTPDEQHYQECQMDVRTADPENPRWHMLHNPEGWDKYGEGDEVPLFAKDLPQEAPSANSSADTLNMDSNTVPESYDTPHQSESDGFDSLILDLDERECAKGLTTTTITTTTLVPKEDDPPIAIPETPLVDGWSLEEPGQEATAQWEPVELTTH
jgi:hypothetical protein